MATIKALEREGESVRLTIAYDGPVPGAGRMEARDLAPAMLSMAKLFEHTAQQMYGTTATLSIDVQADFRRGSFEYELVARAVEVATTLLQNISISDVIISSELVFRLIRRARGRAPANIERGTQTANITFHDGDVITVNAQTVNLYLNQTIRQDAEGVVEPLKRPGVDEFRMTTPITDPITVMKDEVRYFEAPVSDAQVLQDSTSVQILEVLSPDFKQGNKWKFSLPGVGTIWAEILDNVYRRRVAEHRETFGSGDALRVRLHTIVSRMPDGRIDRQDEILEVIEKIPPPPPQPTLFPA